MSVEFLSEFSDILKDVQSQIDEFPDAEEMETNANEQNGPYVDTDEDVLISFYENKIRQLREDVDYLKTRKLQMGTDRKKAFRLELSKHYNCSSLKDINLKSIEKQLEWTEDWTGVQFNNVSIKNISEKEKSALTLMQLEGSFKNVQFALEMNIKENKHNPFMLPFIAKVNAQILQAESYELTEIVKRFKKTKSLHGFIKSLTECIQTTDEKIFE